MNILMKLINGDCLEELPKLESNSIDLVLVDVPYGQTACKFDVKIDLTTMWKELLRVGKENTAFVFFTTTKYGVDLINSNPKMFRYDLVWQKSKIIGFLSAKKMPLRKHEMVYVFYKKLPTYNPQMTDLDRVRNYNHKDNALELYALKEYHRVQTYHGKYPTSVLNVANPNHKSLHPTQKPVEILEWLIKTYSNENDVVLDFTMGSASTGIACINTKRQFIGIEKNDEIFKIAEKRINEYINENLGI